VAQGGTLLIACKPASILGFRTREGKKKAPIGVCQWELQFGDRI